jgi:hypothetical protein
MRAYDFDGDSRSAHRTSAASMMTVNGPSGAIDKDKQTLFGSRSFVVYEPHLA